MPHQTMHASFFDKADPINSVINEEHALEYSIFNGLFGEEAKDEKSPKERRNQVY